MSEELNIRYDKLDKWLDELLIEMEDVLCQAKELNNKPKCDYKKKFYDNFKSKVIYLDERKLWKKKIYNKCDELVRLDKRFVKGSEVLHCLYNYMRINYSIVWEQEMKVYEGYRPKTIDIVYDNEMYRSILEARLYDMITDAKKLANLSIMDSDIMEM